MLLGLFLLQSWWILMDWNSLYLKIECTNVETNRYRQCILFREANTPDSYVVFVKGEESQNLGAKELESLLRSMGQNVTQAELQEIMKVANSTEGGTGKPMDFPLFLKNMVDKMEGSELEKELITVFKVITEQYSSFPNVPCHCLISNCDGDGKLCGPYVVSSQLNICNWMVYSKVCSYKWTPKIDLVQWDWIMCSKYFYHSRFNTSHIWEGICYLG